jgi:hypothetical protein
MRSPTTRLPVVNATLALLLAMGASLSVVSTAHAQGIVYGNSVPMGVTIENDVILFGETVVIDGTVEGDVIALGSTVRVNGTISGALVSAGQSVTIAGRVGGSVYAASLVLGLGPASTVGRGVYFAGGELDTAQGSAIARDISAIALGARLDGDLGRNMNAIIGPVELFRLAVQGINGLLGANRIQLPPLLSPTSAIPKVPALEPAARMMPRLQSMGPSAGPAIRSAQVAVDTERLLAWLLRLGLDFVTFAVLGLLTVLLAPSMLSRGAYRIRTSPWAALGWGLAVFATGIVTLIIASAVVVAISMLFWALSLGALGTVTFTVGIFSVLLAAAFYVLLVLFCSKLVAGYFIGRVILTAITPRAAEIKILAMLLGVLVYLLLAAIPYLGWLVSAGATFVGLGAIWLSVRDTGRL